MPRVKFPNDYNVFKEFTPENEGHAQNKPENLKVHPFIKKLIDKLHARQPTWEFVAEGWGHLEDGKYVHSRLFVDSDGERLGMLDMTRHWRTGDMKYEFNCDRLRAKRTKNTTPATKDLNKAVKTILEHMFNRTPEERRNAAIHAVAHMVNRAAGSAEYNLNSGFAALRDPLITFARLHREQFATIPLAQAQAVVLEGLFQKKDIFDDVQTISGPAMQNKGTLLIDAGGKYIVSKYSSGSSTEVKRLDELSDRLKTSLGILKLLEPKKYAAGIGIRADETTFYVVEEDE